MSAVSAASPGELIERSPVPVTVVPSETEQVSLTGS